MPEQIADLISLHSLTSLHYIAFSAPSFEYFYAILRILLK